MMPTRQQRQKLRDALINAFPNKSSLDQLLYFELDKNLNEITNRDSSLEVIVFELIRTAESQGWLLDLVRAARDKNRKNSSLQAIAQELLASEADSLSNITLETRNQQQKILFLAAHTDRLHLNEEIQKIEEVIRQADKQDFKIIIRTAVHSLDIIHEVIREERPQIVHVCGQGNTDGFLILKDEGGNEKPISPKKLAELFKRHSTYVNCVLLNLSYSSKVAKLISHYIDYAIGMNNSISNKAAILFAQGFYRGLEPHISKNQDVIQKAFEEGVFTIKSKDNITISLQASIPVFKKRIQTEYYQWLINNYQRYQTEGLSQNYGLELQDVFVPLKISSTYHNKAHSELIGQVGHEANNERGEYQIWDFLAETVGNLTLRRMVMLGGPGTGKSTLLRDLTIHLTIIYAINASEKQYSQAPELIPVLLIIRHLYQEIVNSKTISLADLISKQVKQIIKEDRLIQSVLKWLIEELNRKENNKCLIMLDGLDEVADENQRQLVSDWVDEQIQAYPYTTFFLTSRPRGYKVASLKNVGIVLELRPFNLDQVRSFIRKWYLATEKIRFIRDEISKIEKQAQQQAEDLINRIRNNSPLAAMAVNPLLLTMIATVHHQLRFENRSLPKKRAELYKEMCEVLLEKRQLEKKIPERVKCKNKQYILQVLALELMKQENTEFRLDDAISWIQEQLTTVVSNEVNPKELIEYIRDISGLLVERDLKYHQFAHLSFQEYLAAVEIQKLKQENLLIANINNSWWSETIRLYAAQSDVTNLIISILRMPSPSIDTWALAYDCLEESLRVDEKVRQELIRRLEEGLESNNPETFKLAVEVRLTRRLKNFVRISEELEIDSNYVTCSEYQLFLDETEEPSQPRNWRNRRFPVGDAQETITGVSWENALRFCAWLGEWYRRRLGNKLSELAVHYRLAKEEEEKQHSIHDEQQFSENGIRLVKFQLPSKYNHLAYYLWSGQWQNADWETASVMLQIAGKERQGFIIGTERSRYLDLEDIENFPCEDLHIIDRLWIYASKGRFGFSVQKSIYQSLGGTSEEYKWNNFGDRVGWRHIKYGWLPHAQYTFTSDAPKGHLPSPSWDGQSLDQVKMYWDERGGWGGPIDGVLRVMKVFFSRLGTCRL